MRYPKFIKPGDSIGFVAPSFGATTYPYSSRVKWSKKYFESLGYNVEPKWNEKRADIVQNIIFGNEDDLVKYCIGIQSSSPVDSYVKPMPWNMPGYDDKVVMAAGSFTQGSSIELSADGPIREPYAVYFQGGITWYHAKLGILRSLQEMLDANLLNLET